MLAEVAARRRAPRRELALRGGDRGLRGLGGARPRGPAPHLLRLAELIDENVERIAAVECEDMAMLLESLRARVISRGARNYRAYAELAAAYEERVWSSNGTANRVIRMPAGPRGRDHALERAVHALDLEDGARARRRLHGRPEAGRVVAALLLAARRPDASRPGCPPGVFNVVQGIGEEAGAALVSNPLARRISFTGSPETARSIGRAAAANLVPFTGELGGKGPLLVFDDADLDDAADRAASMYDDAGQVCLAGTRLLVEDAASPSDFLERFDAAVDAHVLGDPREPETTISPLIHPDHLARVEGFVERAREARRPRSCSAAGAPSSAGPTASGTSRP